MSGSGTDSLEAGFVVEHPSGPLFLAPTSSLGKPRRADIPEHDPCCFCSPQVDDHEGSRPLPSGGRAHPNPWPLSFPHLVVIPPGGHVEDPFLLDASWWFGFLTSVFEALAPHPDAVVGTSLGHGSAASVAHLHAQVVGAPRSQLLDQERVNCPFCTARTTVYRSGAVEVRIPDAGLDQEVILAASEHPGPSMSTVLPDLADALPWALERLQRFGHHGVNLVVHPAGHAHIHLRPSPLQRSGLEDALGLTVVRRWGLSALDLYA